MPFSYLMFDDMGVWGPSLAVGQAFGFGPAVTSFLFQVPRRRSPSAATGRHLPFGPAVKCWHAQRHIGFHYFHSYEGATVDSDRATTAHPPSPWAFPHHLETQPCAPMKTNLFRCHLMILHHLANKMFYDATGFLPPGSLPKKRGVS